MPTYCWTCYIKERYVDSTNTVINWYKHSFVDCDKSEAEIEYFERQNTVIVDSVRMIGDIMECTKN